MVMGAAAAAMIAKTYAKKTRLDLCDYLAGEPYDTKTSSAKTEKIGGDPAEAVSVCTDAAHLDSNPRYADQKARALENNGKLEDAANEYRALARGNCIFFGQTIDIAGTNENCPVVFQI